MTRRSFCFLFGAGVAGALLVKPEPLTVMGYPVKFVDDLGTPAIDFARQADVTHVSLYAGPQGGPHKLLGTFPAAEFQSFNVVSSSYDGLRVTGRTFDGETVPVILR